MKNKIAVLVAVPEKGNKLVCVAGHSLEPLLVVAKKARSTGLIGKTQVVEGVVFATWKIGTAFKFTYRPPVEAPEAPEAPKDPEAPEAPEVEEESTEKE